MKLRDMLVYVGLVGAAGVALYAARPDVPNKDFRDALADCPDTHVVCVTYEGNNYHRRALLAHDCRDAGVGFVLKGKAPDLVEGSCVEAGDGVVPPMELPLECACRTKLGACDANLRDGGYGSAPFGRTLAPGWSGPGCERKACVELAGSSSWPNVCPRK